MTMRGDIFGQTFASVSGPKWWGRSSLDLTKKACRGLMPSHGFMGAGLLAPCFERVVIRHNVSGQTVRAGEALFAGRTQDALGSPSWRRVMSVPLQRKGSRKVGEGELRPCQWSSQGCPGGSA
jgi:hypothetical protein